MAVKCPQCASSIEADFGVATCSQCGFLLFVGLDGSPEASVPTVMSQVDESQNQESLGSSDQPLLAEETPSWEPLEGSQDPTNFGSEPNLSSENEYLEAMNLEPSIEEKQESQEPAVFVDANDEASPVAYTVIIDEIDTKEIREQLREALRDEKFQWDAQELLAKISRGQLRLEGVNPVKASVLVHRLANVAVRISWEQNVVI
jgi:hypothetical protein